MNIAQQINHFYMEKADPLIDVDELVNECKRKAIKIENSEQSSLTVFTFEDGSRLAACNNWEVVEIN